MIENHISGNLYNELFSESSEERCKKWPFYNVISVRNLNVPNYNVILTQSKSVTTSNK